MKPKKAKRARQPRRVAGTIRPVCGLCGKSGKLTRTDCCDNPICDDEDSYVLFSFARNSCSRNHNRFTLCGYHYNEGHKAAWQDCGECRAAFETEMYVFYGTNEYNFVQLSDPPEYEPTFCSKCGSTIRLGEGGYSIKGGLYTCGECSDGKFDFPIDGL